MARIIRVHESCYEEGYLFKCPGCKGDHVIPVRYNAEQISRRAPNVPAWSFNGDLDRPTFMPSLLVRWTFYNEDHGFHKKNICHSFVREGMIQFLTDCTHALAGKTVELPEIKAS